MTDQEPTTPTVTGHYHPACKLLPEMTDEEYRDLVEDIREHGQRHPIVVDQRGVILDGRHRWRAVWHGLRRGQGERPDRTKMSSDDPMVPILCPACHAELEQIAKMLEGR